jgi:hypothetical protein
MGGWFPPAPRTRAAIPPPGKSLKKTRPEGGCRPAGQARFIPMSVQDETKARRIPGCWRGASEAHIRSDLQRASNEASSPEDKRISLILNANWN